MIKGSAITDIRPTDFTIVNSTPINIELGITLRFEGATDDEKAIVVSIEDDKASALKLGF